MRLAAGQVLLRAYADGTRSDAFRSFGSLHRFDHHRTDGDGRPQDDPERGVLHAAETLVCCLGERFDDEGQIELGGSRVGQLRLVEELALIDLRGTAATAVGTITAIGMVGERAQTQAWSRWLYEHRDLSAAHGLVYSSAQTGHDGHVIWERAAGAISAGDDWSLGAPEIQDELELAADELNLPVFPLP